jgi:hypothetical protein
VNLVAAPFLGLVAVSEPRVAEHWCKSGRLGAALITAIGSERGHEVGLWERQTTLSCPTADTVTIGVEFLQHGLRRFFPGIVAELSERFA